MNPGIFMDSVQLINPNLEPSEKQALMSKVKYNEDRRQAWIKKEYDHQLWKDSKFIHSSF